MTLRVFMSPYYDPDLPDRAEGGIRRIVEAMIRHMPAHGIRFVSELRKADLCVGHGTHMQRTADLPFISCNHGLMWDDYDWPAWAHQVNAEVAKAMIQAQAITVPSRWVRDAVARGILRRPVVIHHGVDADEWAHPYPSAGFVLWNKARADHVSDPRDMLRLAAAMPDVAFKTTVGQAAGNVEVIGVLPQPRLKEYVQRAGVYLATARETFGIGTLEALAAGVPVAGWDYGGQSEIIVDGETGYLAPYGDYRQLAEAVRKCLAERSRLSANAVADVRARWGWADKIAQYAELFKRVVDGWTEERPRVSVVVPAYNLAQFLPEALDSLKAQTEPNFECLVVDDCSTDDTAAVVKRYLADARFQYHRTPRNLGLSGVRNTGASLARGKYLLFLDADDALAPAALEALAAGLDREPSLHVAYGSLALMQAEGPPKLNPWPGPFDWRGQMAHNNQIHTGALQRRQVWEEVGGYRERCWRAEDADFWCRATSFGFRAAKVTEESTLHYRLRADSKGQTEARTMPDKDGPWTDWFPWNLGRTYSEGVQRLQAAPDVPNARLVPVSAAGPVPASFNRGLSWNAYHHQRPAVSVVIPVGPGHERHVLDALDSLVAQDLHEWEAVVVNDTGTPMPEIAGAPWARILESPRRGPGAARNAGIQAARGELIVFLDADDWLLPGALRRMLADYERGDVAYVYGDYVHYDKDGRTERWAQLRPYNQRERTSQHGVTVLMARAHLLEVGGFDEALPGYEEWDLFVKLAVMGYCGRHIAAPLYHYRLAAGQRRSASLENKAAIMAELDKRYNAYYTGEKEMGSCCGGNGDAVLAAKRALTGEPEPEAAKAGEPPTSGVRQVVRMEFTGPQVGAVTFTGLNGRTYKGGNNAKDRHCDVHPDDVARLESFGVFRRVVRPPAPEPQAPALPAVEQFPRLDRTALGEPHTPTSVTEPPNPTGGVGEPAPLPPQVDLGEMFAPAAGFFVEDAAPVTNGRHVEMSAPQVPMGSGTDMPALKTKAKTAKAKTARKTRKKAVPVDPTPRRVLHE